ncbi:protein ROLLING AND ERECT LEAF 2-like [Punica granatum]|uniref:Protein ROLLING AND ERECT LEAF 2-like n=2 Tax=Punica granatum TaxID=22663 RepID=A0A6P8BRR8_PUNGR|nr:protein ROLLING AND ERECT LEAF 2-like [Punica granatum]XP_031373024.1 protein ROLLING AND ERECT LEAF 2-like [Punica granatum]OWM86968.1 hypothetical protein CDL15_Pgr016004 [Punica granatum]PKI54819.1 hypothetical protein CRG98_024770 [Punica granatum]
MGCSSSKLDDEEAVRLCKDRKNFIKEAVEQRSRFALGHKAYFQSLKRVSAALQDYIDGDEPREFLLDSFLTPVKKRNPDFISISSKPFNRKELLPEQNSNFTINYLRPGGAPAVLVEERPRSPEIVQVQSYSPVHNHFGIDGFFSYPQYDRAPAPPPQFPPPSPQNSQWDFFWNPFSSLDYYGYPTRSSLDQTIPMDDEIRGLRRVREEEGIPDLEEETEHECDHHEENLMQDRGKNIESDFPKEEEVLVEDVEDEDEEEEEEEEEEEDEGTDDNYGNDNGIKELQSCRSNSRNIEITPPQNSAKVEIVGKQETSVTGQGTNKGQEKPGFTVYVNRRPTSMAEVIRDLETQFSNICNSANEVSGLLEVSNAHYSTTNELSAMKMLNPVALFRSGSSRSSSSRFLISSSSLSKEEADESSSDFSEESSMFSVSHQLTLDRLYAWEKKLYEEVRAGERVRMAYEKKCKQLRNQDVKGEDPSTVDKTRAAIRDLHTRIKVSIHSVEAISKRIETLRDEELQPQLLELAQGLLRMWKVMAECHCSQKRTLDEAKILLAGTPSKLEARRRSHISITDPQRLARSASNLEAELRNWRACFELWVTSQRAYLQALSGWLLRCVRSDPDPSKLAFSPGRSSSSGALPIIGLCIQWSRFLEAVQELPVLDGLDFFAAGMGSIYEQQMKDETRRVPVGSKRFGEDSGAKLGLEVVEFSEEVEEVMTAEKMADVAIRVLCAGMSVAVSSLTEFAIRCADGYSELVGQWEHAKLRPTEI